MDEFLSSEAGAKLKKFLLPILFFGIALICLVYGLTAYFSSQQKKDDISITSDSQTVSPSATPLPKLMVDIEGAVMHPGVYAMTSEDRIQDVLRKAGGLSPDANTDAIAKTINLALKVSDGMKLYIPNKTEAGTAVMGAETQGSGTSTSGSININSASADSLDSLSGVGPVTANKIIAGRPYTTVDDLMKKKIVTQKVFDKIKDQISVY